MKIKFDVGLLNFKGEEITTTERDGTDATGKPKTKEIPLTLEDACTTGLMTVTDPKMSGKEKFKRDQLARKISVGGEVEITVEEASLLKECVGDVFGPNVVGPVWNIIEGCQAQEKDKPDEKDKTDG